MRVLPNLDKIFDELGCFNPILYIKAYIDFYFSEGICQFNNRYLQKKDTIKVNKDFQDRLGFIYKLYAPVNLKIFMNW